MELFWIRRHFRPRLAGVWEWWSRLRTPRPHLTNLRPRPNHLCHPGSVQDSNPHWGRLKRMNSRNWIYKLAGLLCLTNNIRLNAFQKLVKNRSFPRQKTDLFSLQFLSQNFDRKSGLVRNTSPTFPSNIYVHKEFFKVCYQFSTPLKRSAELSSLLLVKRAPFRSRDFRSTNHKSSKLRAEFFRIFLNLEITFKVQTQNSVKIVWWPWILTDNFRESYWNL